VENCDLKGTPLHQHLGMDAGELMEWLIRGFGGLQSGLRRNSFRSKHLAQGAGDAGSLPQLYVTPGVRFTLGHPTPRNTGRADGVTAYSPGWRNITILLFKRLGHKSEAAATRHYVCKPEESLEALSTSV
jgi:hypothetical protein